MKRKFDEKIHPTQVSEDVHSPVGVVERDLSAVIRAAKNFCFEAMSLMFVISD